MKISSMTTVLAVMLGASAHVSSGELTQVPVEATVTMSPGETVQQAVQRIRPQLAEAALMAQPGLTARVVIDRDDHLVTRTTQIQAAVAAATLDNVQIIGRDQASIKMTFTLDNEAGAQYQKLHAENELLKAKLNDAAEALESDQIGKTSVYNKYRDRVAALDAGVRSSGSVAAGLAAGDAQRLVEQAEGRASCSGKYQVVGVENTQYQRQSNGGLSASSQIRVHRDFDSCLAQFGRQATLYFIAWLGNVRMVTAIEQGKALPMPFGGMALQRMAIMQGTAYRDGWGMLSDAGGGLLKTEVSPDRKIFWEVTNTRGLSDKATQDFVLSFSLRGIPERAYGNDDQLRYAIVMAW